VNPGFVICVFDIDRCDLSHREFGTAIPIFDLILHSQHHHGVELFAAVGRDVAGESLVSTSSSSKPKLSG